MAQNPLSINSSQNGKEFLSKLIPDKILETVLGRNFTKKTIFSRNFGSQIPNKVWE